MEVRDEEESEGGGLQGEDGGVGLAGVEAGVATLEPELEQSKGFMKGRGFPDGEG